jgi:hypothetical protein
MNDQSTIKNRPHSVGGVMVDQTMLIPSAELVAAHMAAVPAGETRTLAELRRGMAVEQGADATCPVTTQRMIKIVAAKSVTDHAAGQKAVPFWRVIDPGTPNAQRLPGGRDFIIARRRDEEKKR